MRGPSSIGTTTSEVETPLRLGLVGCGAIASAVHLRALRAMRGVRVTAVADPDAAARRRAQRLVPRAATVTSAEELVARDDVDAVVVCSPSACHADHAVLALESGRHLYLEKPLAIDIEDGRRIVEVAGRANVTAAIGFNWRYQPLVQRAYELLRSGAIGEVREAQTTFCEPGADLPSWKRRRESGGGVALDLGSHHVDLLRWLLDAEVESTSATISSHESEHDEAELRLALTGGRQARSSLSFRDGRIDRLLLRGTSGTLRADRYRRLLQVDPPRRVLDRGLASWRLRSIVLPRSEPSWRRALDAWIAAVRGSDVVLPTLADGLRSLEVVLAAEDAAAKGRRVELAGHA